MPDSRYTGVANLLAPENCTLLLIDHQPSQLASVQSMDRTLLVSNVVGLAKTATREKTINGIADIMNTHGGTVGANIAWEYQRLT